MLKLRFCLCALSACARAPPCVTEHGQLHLLVLAAGIAEVHMCVKLDLMTSMFRAWKLHVLVLAASCFADPLVTPLCAHALLDGVRHDVLSGDMVCCLETCCLVLTSQGGARVLCNKI